MFSSDSLHFQPVDYRKHLFTVPIRYLQTTQVFINSIYTVCGFTHLSRHTFSSYFRHMSDYLNFYRFLRTGSYFSSFWKKEKKQRDNTLGRPHNHHQGSLSCVVVEGRRKKNQKQTLYGRTWIKHSRLWWKRKKIVRAETRCDGNVLEGRSKP